MIESGIRNLTYQIVMAKSGTCNVCSAPCTSCMHFNRLVSGVKTEAFCDNTSSEHSANKSAVLNTLKNHASDNLQDTDTAASSHESLSENIKMNETVGSYMSDEVRHRKSEKDRMESNISNIGGSSFSFVDTKPELRGLDYGENDKGSPAISSSDVPMKPGMKLEPKTERGDDYIPEEALVVSASRGTSNDPAELTDVTEPSSESQSGDESEEVVEQDVNICDICGDAGREDLLATCSGCSDGAEHTYCMQEKMEKVPEGEWFCEECRLAEKIQNQRNVGDEIVKAQPFSRLRSLNRNPSLKLDSKESSVDVSSGEIYTSGSQSRKRLLERVESTTGLKRQVTETSKDLSVASSPRHLSRDGSFKGGSREKMNIHYKSSHGINNASSRPQTHKGPLSKSKSFNAVCLKSKGKTIDDIHHKQKTYREYNDAKDGGNRLMARSMSLRPVHLGRPNAGEPKVIMLSPKSFHAPEMEFKKSKEHISYDRKKSIRDEQASSISSSLPSTLDANRKTSCDNRFMSTCHASRDSKATQSDEKVPQSKLTAFATRNALDMPEKKLNKPHNKDRSTLGTRTAAKHISNGNAILNPELLPPQDASYQAVKNTDNNLTRSRLGKSISGSNLCQRCKEPITPDHVCMTSSPKLSASDPSTVKILVDDIEKMNPVKAALHAASLKKSIIYKKRRAADHEQFDEQPVTPKSNGQNAPQDVLSGSIYTKNTISAEKKHIQKFTLAAGRKSSIDDLNQSALLSQKMIYADVGDDGKSNTKGFHIHSLPHMYAAPTLAIPVLEYIWQGDFEVSSNGEKVADVNPGFQAHLSTCVSPKVMEVVHKLSPKLSLTAVPRLSAWPPQFHETGATEENIALYFFAKDIESYEKYYKILLDNMMRKDLAMKGVVNDVEVLIFPSNQLPQKSQRWNMLFFMWGVFRAKKHNCHSQTGGLYKNLNATGNSCIIASDAPPSILLPLHPVLPTDSKQPECEFIRESTSGHSSSCAQSLSKRSLADSYEGEHAVNMECEVKPNPRLNGGSAIKSMPLMPRNKGTPTLKSSVSDVFGQELLSVGPDGLNCFVKEEKEVDRVKIEGKMIKKDNIGVKSTLKKEPFVKDVFIKDCEFGQFSNKYHRPGDLAKISCIDSYIDTGKTKHAGPDSKDDIFRCSTSDTRETSPSISNKKIMYDLNLDAIDMLEESGTAEGFLSSVKSPKVTDFRGANSTRWDLNSSAYDVQVDGDFNNGQDPGFELALCADTESFPPKNGALPLFTGMGGRCEGLGFAGKREVAPAASLSLSLALQLDDKQQSSKQGTNSAEKLKTPFLLFGGLVDK